MDMTLLDHQTAIQAGTAGNRAPNAQQAIINEQKSQALNSRKLRSLIY